MEKQGRGLRIEWEEKKGRRMERMKDIFRVRVARQKEFWDGGKHVEMERVRRGKAKRKKPKQRNRKKQKKQKQKGFSCQDRQDGEVRERNDSFSGQGNLFTSPSST